MFTQPSTHATRAVAAPQREAPRVRANGRLESELHAAGVQQFERAVGGARRAS